MSLLLTLGLALAAQALAADAAAWERVFQDAESTQFVDPASIRRDGAQMRVRWRFDFSRSSSEDGMQRLIADAVIDCPARSFSLRRMEGYRADGSLINGFDLPADHPQAAMHPLSAQDETTYRRVCGTAAR